MDIIKFANKLNTLPDTATILKWILPRANTLINSVETVRALHEAGIRMFELKTATIAYLLSKNRPKEALNICDRSNSHIEPFIVQPAIGNYIKTKNFERNASSVVELIKKLQGRCRDKGYVSKLFSHFDNVAVNLLNTSYSQSFTPNYIFRLLS